MDDRRFDALARLFGAAATRRGAVAALAGLAAGGAALDADAKKKKKCSKDSPPGQCCKKGVCTCTNGGTVCGTDCCTGLETCTAGVCHCTVCADGCPHTTIEAAIAAAASGDVITIAPGTYQPVPIDSFGSAIYLLVFGTDLTLKSCDPQGVVTVSCPRLDTVAVCIAAVDGTVAVDGLRLDGGSDAGSNETRSFGFAVASQAVPTSGALIRTAVHGFDIGIDAEADLATARIEIGDAVSVDDWNEVGLVSVSASITCNAPVEFGTGTGPACANLEADVAAACGCPS